MYEKIENIIVRTISPLEYEKLNHLLKTFSEDEIINAYKIYGDKPITYIQKVLNTEFKNKSKKIVPNWLEKEVVNEEVDDEAKEIYNDFNNFINDFRN